MKNFTLNVIMAVAVMMGMSLNVNAALYNDLAEAQAALDSGVKEASSLALQWMDKEVYNELKEANDLATKVWDSSDRQDKDKIEAVMPALNEAIEKAKVSVAEYAKLSEVVEAYTIKMQDVIAAKSEELEEEYDGTETWEALYDALLKYNTYFNNTLAELKNNVSQEMLDAANNGTFVVEDNIELVSIDEIVEGILAGKDFDEIVTGISSVVAVPANSNIAYGLDGNKVSENYKGIVIKGGKKYVVK